MKKKLSEIISYPFFPYLTGILFIYDKIFPINTSLDLPALIYRIGLTFIIVLVIILLCRRFMNGDRLKGNILAALILYINFSFADIMEIIRRSHALEFLMHSFPGGRMNVTAILILMFIIVIAAIMLKRKSTISGTFPIYLNILFLILISSLFFKNPGLVKPEINNNAFRPSINIDSTIEKPDIYFIVLDSYTSTNALKKYWDFNDSTAINYLKSHNFFVFDSCKSTYDITPFSLSSTLNSETYIRGEKFWSFHQVEIIKDRIRYAETFSFFNKLGYNIKNYSPFDVGNTKSFYNDFFYDDDPFWSTMFYKFFDRVKKIFVDDKVKLAQGIKESHENILQALNNDIPMEKQPSFYYIHLLTPHLPYIFKSDGSENNPSEFFKADDKDLYLGQLIYTNSLMKKVVDLIFSKGKKEKIIIIQGDHGFRFLEDARNESHSVFNAVYFYDGNYNFNSKNFNIINTYRAILNHSFKTNLSYMPDRHFFLLPRNKGTY